MTDEIEDSGEVMLSDISEFGESVPKGRYKARLAACNGKMSKFEPSHPEVEAAFDILEGDEEGSTLTFYFGLNVSVTKIKRGPNIGKDMVTARGITDMKAACAAIGKPLPDQPFKKKPSVEDAQRMALEFAKRFHPDPSKGGVGMVEIAVLEKQRVKKVGDKWVDQVDENGKPVMKPFPKVIGPWGGMSSAGAQASNPTPLAGIGLG
jgi:hypothetical protein